VVVQDLKGKAPANRTPQETTAFQIVFTLLRSQLCQRSNSHLVGDCFPLVVCSHAQHHRLNGNSITQKGIRNCRKHQH